MVDKAKLETIREKLGAAYGDLGRSAGERLAHWLSGEVPYAFPEILERHLDEGLLPLIFDAFWQVLPFGTGGRRGRVGYGSNRMNPTTVAMTVQAHCQYLRSTFPDRKDLTVVVANDVRIFLDVFGTYGFLGQTHPLIGTSSRTFAKLACEIYAGNGIIAYIAKPSNDKALLSTPELSFLISEMGAVGGVIMSASHNPPDDNGVKLYDSFASQPVAPDDQRLLDVAQNVTEIKSIAFEQALSEGLIRPVPSEMHGKYVGTYVKLYDNLETPDPAYPIVYTPLCGCGLTNVTDVLSALHFPVQVPPGQGPDGTFSTIPFKTPNPEVPQSTEPARDLADSIGSSIVLSSDPDADRVGLEGRLADGTWYHFDGNQIATILCYLLMLDPRGPQRSGLVIETLVTTKILSQIVQARGDGSQIVDDLLVGFKYVADVLKSLIREGRFRHIVGRQESLILAAEESHGVMIVPTIRDKDSTPACMYLAGLHQRLRREGRTLLDYYIEILERFGGYDNVSRSIMLQGAEGMRRKEEIMTSLREAPPATLAGSPVKDIADYQDTERFGPFKSESELLPRNVLQITTERYVITVRPSGTEPKLKFYCQLLPQDAHRDVHGMDLLHSVRGEANAICGVIYNELLQRIGLLLSDAALLLPDMIDMERKMEFDSKMVPGFKSALQNGEITDRSSLLAWLKPQTSSLMPGVDPLPAFKAPLAWLCEQWTEEVTGPGLEASRAWSQE